MLAYHPGTAKVAAVDRQLMDRDLFLAEIKERLFQAQNMMKAERRREVVFAVGDWVWLRLHHRSATTIKPTSPTKLGPRFYGPFQVIQRIGDVAYKLQLPLKACIHDVFHVSMLNKFEGVPPTSVVPLPDLLHDRVIRRGVACSFEPWCLGGACYLD